MTSVNTGSEQTLAIGRAKACVTIAASVNAVSKTAIQSSHTLTGRSYRPYTIHTGPRRVEQLTLLQEIFAIPNLGGRVPRIRHRSNPHRSRLPRLRERASELLAERDDCCGDRLANDGAYARIRHRELRTQQRVACRVSV